MLTNPVIIAVMATVTASALLGLARANAAEVEAPNLAGTYRCEPYPSPCRSGQTVTVTQSGGRLEFKTDTGTVGHANFTSNISLSGTAPWNALGVITANNTAIEWSDGTRWRKQ